MQGYMAGVARGVCAATIAILAAQNPGQSLRFSHVFMVVHPVDPAVETKE